MCRKSDQETCKKNSSLETWS